MPLGASFMHDEPPPETWLPATYVTLLALGAVAMVMLLSAFQ